MAFEMSLPHAPRVQVLAADGSETLAQDEQQWELYFTAQKALAAQEGGNADGQQQQAEGGEAGEAQAKPAQPSDPQKVLEKLLTARGELDVISDLVSFVEQQQFLAVAGIHRHPPTLEERVRARALRLAAAKRALRRAGERLAGGAAALRAHQQIDARFLADLASLRRRWRLRRHAGDGGLFYADLSLPLRGVAAQGVVQEGAQCGIIQDTNGDACIVEAAAAGGKRRVAVRGADAMHAVLAAKQALLTWQVLRQLVGAAARQQRYEADPEGAVAAVLQLVGAACAACQAAVYAAVAASSSGGAAAMDVDGAAADGAAAAAAAAEAEAEAEAAPQPAVASSSSLTQSSTARNIQAALVLPGFQQRFEARALGLLSRLLAAGGSGSSAAEVHRALLEALLRWLRHAALVLRAGALLRRWAAGGGGRAAHRLDSGDDFAVVWRLEGCRGAGAAPVLAVAVDEGLRLEGLPGGGGGGAAGLQQRGLTQAQFERALLDL